MKSTKKEGARILRLHGLSMKEIAQKLNVAKSSVSIWVHDIELTDKQKQELSEKGITRELIEKRRVTRLRNESGKRQLIIDAAKAEIKKISLKELKLLGSLLYWAEGGKTKRGLVRFSNSDPEMNKFMMNFLRTVCRVPEKKFRGYIHIHPHLDYRKAEKYWSNITKIPLNQFFKTYRKMNVASKHKRDNLPMGTMDIYVCSTELFLKISGWVQGIFNAHAT